MIFETSIDSKNKKTACDGLLEAWKERDKKVFVFRASEKIDDVRGFYEDSFRYLGNPERLAEDANISSRNEQRTGEVWMEVRYDPKIPNAYRHSSNAQPLHTDGSYNPDFPSTLLCCVANSEVGGETVFIDSEALSRDLRTSNPDLFEKVTTERILHERSGDRRSEFPIYQKDGKWFVNWNYYCVSDKITREQRNTVEEFQEYLLNSPEVKANTVEVKLAPGDGVIWKDDEVLHGRNSFKATETSERFIWKCMVAIGESA